MLIHWLLPAPVYQPPYRTGSVYRRKERGGEGKEERGGGYIYRSEGKVGEGRRGEKGGEGREREQQGKVSSGGENYTEITPTKLNTTLYIASPLTQTLTVQTNKQTHCTTNHTWGFPLYHN